MFRRYAAVSAFLAAGMLVAAVAGYAATFTKFRADCAVSHFSSDDPIVFPGQPGATHEHVFFGNTTTDAFSTYSSMVAGGTSCVLTDDTAGYWMPRLKLDGANHPLKKNIITSWYSQPEACPRFACMNAPEMEVDHTFPRDLRIIAGKASASSGGDNPLVASENVMWNCYPALGNTFDGLPNECKALGGARADLWVRFPVCWNGTTLDSPDHRSHMAYPTSSGCPSSHPVVLPQLVVQVSFQPFNGSEWQGVGDGYSSGAFYTIHFDFWNTWQQAGLVALTGGVDGPDLTNQPPTAAFSASCVNLTCTYDAATSSDPDGSITSYAWTFGDGATGSGVTASHCYATAGTYTATLTVTDNAGAQDSEQQPVSPSTRRC